MTLHARKHPQHLILPPESRDARLATMRHVPRHRNSRYPGEPSRAVCISDIKVGPICASKFIPCPRHSPTRYATSIDGASHRGKPAASGLKPAR